LHLIIIIFVAFIVLKTTTFGLRFWGGPFVNVAKVDARLVERLRSHVYKLAHDIGDRSVFNYEKLEETAEYIIEQFKSFGYDVELQDYTVSGKKVNNIIALKKGIKKPEEIIIVGAHYDTCFNPGADDNASAVAGLLELARFTYDKQTQRSIKFIAFVNEEPPFFKTERMGSRVYARAAKARADKIKAVLILEMIGYYPDKLFSQRYPPIYGLFYPNKGNFIGVIGNFSSWRLGRQIVSNFKEHTQFPIELAIAPSFVPGVDFSDHWSFWKEGYPAVMITDTGPYRNPYYHSGSDTCEKLNYESMAEVVNALSKVLDCHLGSE